MVRQYSNGAHKKGLDSKCRRAVVQIGKFYIKFYHTPQKLILQLSDADGLVRELL
jgi:hypothetical protein